jgi:hypothetical protein
MTKIDDKHIDNIFKFMYGYEEDLILVDIINQPKAVLDKIKVDMLYRVRVLRELEDLYQYVVSVPVSRINSDEKQALLNKLRFIVQVSKPFKRGNKND